MRNKSRLTNYYYGAQLESSKSSNKYNLNKHESESIDIDYTDYKSGFGKKYASDLVIAQILLEIFDIYTDVACSVQLFSDVVLILFAIFFRFNDFNINQ